MRKAACLGIIFLAALSSVARAAPATDAQLSGAQAALDAGDAAQAKRLVDTALGQGQVTPLQRSRLLHNRGIAHELLGNHREALADYTAALQTRALPAEERAQALLQRGFLQDSLGRLDDATRDYSAAVALKTTSAATALNNRANIYRRQNRLVEARRDYLAALGMGNARPQFSYYGLGQIAEARHDKEAARGFYARAVGADPGYRLAVERLAELGGPPDAAIADPGVVKLRPPPSRQPVLKPPVTGQIVLRPPPGKAAPRKGSPGPGLRPALDAAAGPAGREVQLGSWRSEAEARVGWSRAVSLSGGALDGLTPRIVAADLPGRGRYYRLRTTTPNPASLCETLRAARQDCLRAGD
jgi:tetratricopeptide (TPR) repeat protein